MSNNTTHAYATALLEVAKAEGAIERVENELFRVARAIESNDQLRMALSDQAVPAVQREKIVEQLLGNIASPITTSLVSFVVGAGRARALPEIIDEVVRRSAVERGETVAEIRTALPLDDDQQTRLAEALSRQTGKKVSLKVVVDPSVLGGVVAQIGDEVIDGSVRNRLQQLKEAI